MSVQTNKVPVTVPQNWRSAVAVLSSLVAVFSPQLTGSHVSDIVQTAVVVGSSLVLGLERLANSIESGKAVKSVPGNGIIGS